MREGDRHALAGAIGSIENLVRIHPHGPEEVAGWISVSLLSYLFDTSRAACVLIDSSHVEQAALVVRSLISTATNIRVIWKDPAAADGIALQYLLFSQQARTRRFRHLVAQDEIDSETADLLDSEERDREAKLLKRLADERGVAPVRLGPRVDTWSGLTDRDLMQRAWGTDDWYADYSDMSNASHANVAGIWQRLAFRKRESIDTFTDYGLANTVVELCEDAAVAVARGLGTGQDEAIGRAATAFWWADEDKAELDDPHHLPATMRMPVEDD